MSTKNLLNNGEETVLLAITRWLPGTTEASAVQGAIGRGAPAPPPFEKGRSNFWNCMLFFGRAILLGEVSGGI